MRRHPAPDAGMLILAELGQWTGEERTQYVSALRELSVRAAVRVTVVLPADPLAEPPAASLPGVTAHLGYPAAEASRRGGRRPAWAAAFGEAERAVQELWQPEAEKDITLRAALAHAVAEVARMREVLLTPGA